MNPYRTYILIYYRQRDGGDDVTTARHITMISLTVFTLRQNNGPAIPTGVTMFCVHSATVHGLCPGCPKHELFNTHLMCCSNRPVQCSSGAVPHSPAEQNAVMDSVCASYASAMTHQRTLHSVLGQNVHVALQTHNKWHWTETLKSVNAMTGAP